MLYNLNNDHILYHILKKTQQVKFDMIGLVMIFTNEDFIETLIYNRIRFLTTGKESSPTLFKDLY